MAKITRLRETDGDQHAGADPLRAALAAAIVAAGEARQAVTRQKAGIERTRASMYAAAAAMEKVQEGVGKAQQDYADALAGASETPPPSSGVRKARQAVT